MHSSNLDFEASKLCASVYFVLGFYSNQNYVHFQCFCSTFPPFFLWRFFRQVRKWRLGEVAASFTLVFIMAPIIFVLVVALFMRPVFFTFFKSVQIFCSHLRFWFSTSLPNIV